MEIGDKRKKLDTNKSNKGGASEGQKSPGMDLILHDSLCLLISTATAGLPANKD